MTQWHRKSKRKATGGLRTSVRARDKDLSEKGGIPALTRVEEENYTDKVRTAGGNVKLKIMEAGFASVTDTSANKATKTKILGVTENDASPLFLRRNIITKGAIIKLEGDKYARVTSRPGQSGLVQAVLLPDFKPRK